MDLFIILKRIYQYGGLIFIKVNYRFVWLLKGKFELATDEYDTEAEKPKAQSAKLKGNFFSREFDGNYRFIADEDVQGVDATIISDWFTEVPDEPVGV